MLQSKLLCAKKCHKQAFASVTVSHAGSPCDRCPGPWKTLEATSRSCLESVERSSPLPELPCPAALQDGRRVGDSSDGPRTESKEAARPLGTPPALDSKP